MKLLFSGILISILFLNSCKTTNKAFTANNPIEELTVELFEIIKKKDFNAFEKLMADEKNIRQQSENDPAKVNSNSETGKRIFDSFYERNIDWQKVNINKVTFQTRGSEILKYAQVNIKFSDQKNNCILNFPNWLKPRNESWQLGHLPPEFNCFSN